MGEGVPAGAVTVKLDCGGPDDVAETNAAGWPYGATEVRCLAAYDDKLFVGTGLWCDKPPEGDVPNPGPAIMRLDSGNSDLVIEHMCRAADTAVSMLYPAHFKSAGKTVFVAGTWHAQFCDLYVRDKPSSSWHFAQSLDSRDGGQIRSAITYTDPVTGETLLFLGQQPLGIFSLGYDANARGGLGPATLELDTSDVPLGNANAPRVMSFAVLGGELYASVLNNLYKRANGETPSWACVHSDDVESSKSGWRGLTQLGDTSTTPGYFFVAREGPKGAILKLVPGAGDTWTQTVVYDINAELEEAWSLEYGGDVKVGYTIAAYNAMVWLQPPGANHWALWVGLEASVNQCPPSFPLALGDAYAALGSYLVWNWHKDGKWKLNQLPPVTSQPMVACRCGLPAPFPNGTRFYIGGHDCNSKDSHNSGFLIAVDQDRLIDGALT